MSKKNRKILLPAFTSLVFSYSIYVFVLQTPTFLSRSRLLFAGLIGGILFLLLWWAESRFKIFKLPEKQARWGGLSLFIFLNLTIIGFLSAIPYTYIFLPTQSVSISRVVSVSAKSDQEGVRITSFDTELVKGVSLPNFAKTDGWQAKANTIFQDSKSTDPLIWRGKPGGNIAIILEGCDDCDEVKISWNDSESQLIDRSPGTGQERIGVKHEFSSLWWHKGFNFLAIEISALLLALLVTNISIQIFRKLESEHRRSNRESVILSRFSPLMGLAGLTLISYGMKVQPVLFNDDWCLIYRLYIGDIHGFATADRRPLQWIIPWLFSRFLPYDQVVAATYLVQIVILFFTAFFLYVLISKLLYGKKWFAFLVAVLYLVFPTDYTRLYLTMTGIRPAFLLLLLVFIILIDFLKIEDKLKSTGWMLLSIVLLVISLLIYEGQMGLAFVVPVIMIVLTRTRLTRQKVIGLGGYYLAIGVFAYWKLIVQPRFYPDGKIEGLLAVGPVEVIGRYFYAIRTFLGGFQFPYPDASWLSIWNIILILAAIIGSLVLVFVSIRLSQNGTTDQSEANVKDFNRNFFWILLVGAILWLAGYVPIILNFPPNIYGHLSRVNLFSIPGAVLILLALLAIFLRSVASTKIWVIRGITAAVLLLVFLGVVIQLQTQEAYNYAWDNTKTFYGELFDRVPNLEEGTQVVLELTGYEDFDGRLYRPVYSSFWEGMCSLGMLYDQADFDLGVVYRYQTIEVPPFPDLIVLPSTLETNTLDRVQTQNLDDWLILRYNRHTNELIILDELPSAYGEYLTGTYQPYKRIIPLGEPLENRKIVE